MFEKINEFTLWMNQSMNSIILWWFKSEIVFASYENDNLWFIEQ